MEIERRRSSDTDVAQLKKDMYFGDGPLNPSVTGRLFKLEEQVKEIKSDVAEIKKTQEKLLWGILATLAGTVGNMLIHILWK
jgi:hypothetical protein